jgi:FkbM family methyltransferase
VHAGTFFGDILPSSSQEVSGKTYAFEPVFENYILARLCVKANQLDNVMLMNSALSESLGSLLIDTAQSDGRHAGGGSSISDHGEICAAIDIDRLQIDDLVLIQLDVEGHELSALKGARHTIKASMPVIAIEDHHGNCAGFLAGLNDESIGSIPGLTLWVPGENTNYRNFVQSLLARSLWPGLLLACVMPSCCFESCALTDEA